MTSLSFQTAIQKNEAGFPCDVMCYFLCTTCILADFIAVWVPGAFVSRRNCTFPLRSQPRYLVKRCSYHTFNMTQEYGELKISTQRFGRYPTQFNSYTESFEQLTTHIHLEIHVIFVYFLIHFKYNFRYTLKVN